MSHSVVVRAMDCHAIGAKYETHADLGDFAFFFYLFSLMNKILNIMSTIRIIEYNHLNPTLRLLARTFFYNVPWTKKGYLSILFDQYMTFMKY